MLVLLKRNALFRKAAKVKDLYFQKLDEILASLRRQDEVVTSLAANDTSVMETLAYLVANVQRQQKQREQHDRQLDLRLAEIEKALAAIARRLEESERRTPAASDAPRSSDNGVSE